MGGERTRVVAVSLDEPDPHVLCQVLHEETHPVTDPAVYAANAGAARDTRLDEAGHALHLAAERAVVERDQALIEDEAAELLPAYAAWRERYGV